MSPTTLHLLFTPSGRPELAEALAASGENAEVIALVDALNEGPINPVATQRRLRWWSDELGVQTDDKPDEDWAEALDNFWDRAVEGSERRVAWFSRKSAGMYAGFLEWVSRTGDEAPIEVVDLTDLRDGRGMAAIPALMTPVGLRETAYWQQARALSVAETRAYRSLWARLRREDAPLRVLEDGELVSAPATYFDDLLLSFVDETWQSIKLPVGFALAEFGDRGAFQVGDLILLKRMQALIDEGRLETRGGRASVHKTEVRLPRAS